MVHVCFHEGCAASLKARKKDCTIIDDWQLALVVKLTGCGFISVLRMKDIAQQPTVTQRRPERRCIIEINFPNDIKKMKI